MPRGLSRRPELSQHFLTSPDLVRRLVSDADFSSTDVVVEIGPGHGIITRALADACGHVLALEQDTDLVEVLRRDLHDRQNVSVFAGDALTFPLPQTPFKVFSNIPFRFSSAIVSKLTTGCAPPVDTHLIVQREAADRYLVGHEMTMQAIKLAPWFEVSIEHRFRRKDFAPPPSVKCVLMRIRRRARPQLPWQQRERFDRMIEALISTFRPTVLGALVAVAGAKPARVIEREVRTSLECRPSRLPIDGWIHLHQTIIALNDSRLEGRIAQRSGEFRKREANRRHADRDRRDHQGRR